MTSSLGYHPKSVHDPEFFPWARAQTDAMHVTPFFDAHNRLVAERRCPICCPPGLPTRIIWSDEEPRG